MTTENPSPTLLPPTGAPPHWPIYRCGSRCYPANIYVTPGIQAPDLLDGNGLIRCSITDAHEALGPGIGTLFHGSFDHAHPVSAAVMGMGQQAIRQRVLEQLIQESMQAQHAMLLALTALKANDLDRYVSLCHDAEGLTCLLANRTSWLAGIMTIMGGPEDPLLRYYLS